jgi:hypothetical protein
MKIKSEIKIKKVDFFFANEYLNYRNRLINRKNSTSIKKIKAIDHYIWWLSNKSRKSFKIIKKNKLLAIMYYDLKILKGKKIFFPGYFLCDENIKVFDILKIIKIQNNLLDKFKQKACIIKVQKKNIFSNSHVKYFNYQKLTEKSSLYRELINKKDDKKFNFYYRD